MLLSMAKKYITRPWYHFLANSDFIHGDEISFYFRPYDKMWEWLSEDKKIGKTLIQINFGYSLFHLQTIFAIFYYNIIINIQLFFSATFMPIFPFIPTFKSKISMLAE